MLKKLSRILPLSVVTVATSAVQAFATSNWYDSFVVDTAPLLAIAGIVVAAAGTFLIIKWVISLAKGR